ncbi:uncharacterized protein CDV56_108953 [Aspergillus thermomutatus]|uniref:Serine hydrolase domain-containing protein n=1 Tax=Aspergillus thermomutatus TaxID=41047 RepID=A0A397HP55_ASPTH|nr:uncharacterized protein CDV56_108953 [Aspergillus thermomutatus]RHZ64951.1 hypothetical protein CDV56_108953 [Aspergillus thermomutatus]
MAQRRILCLHGMGGSGQIVKAQLAPLLSKLSSREQHFEFFFPDGPIETKSPGPGLSAMFADAGPFHSWFTWPGDQGNSSASESPALQKPPTAADVATVRDAIEELYDLADQHGPFDGVFGFSQGATLAAGWLMRHERRRQATGPVLDVMTPSPELARFVVLFNAYGIGIAEVEEAMMEGSGEGSSDEEDKEDKEETRSGAIRLATPSLHVCGRRDSFLPGSMALLDACDPGTASFVMHDGGHVVPRDPRTVDEIARAIEALMHRAVT